MKTKTLTYVIVAVALVAILAAAACLAGCGGSTTTTSAVAPTSTTVTAPASTTAPTGATTTASSAPASSSTSAAAAAQTLKVGWVGDLSNPLGLGDSKVLNAMADFYNQSGGLDIGGQKYNVQFIMYDDKADASTATAAVNRLIFQDKVKYILGDDNSDGWIPLAEANKVVTLVYSPSPAAIDPKLKYTFQTSFLNTQLATNWMWFIEKHADVKTVGGLFVDAVGGRNDVQQIQKIFGTLGVNLVDHAFFPADTQDFGALATRITKTNPQVYTSSGIGPIPIEMSWKGMTEAGYKGMLFSYRPVVPEVWASIAPLSLLEGQVFVLSDIDAARLQGIPMTGVLKDVYDNYVKKYGKWDFPSTDFSGSWFLLKTAMEKAGSLDVDQIATAISSGIAFESPFGPGKMIKRPDMNNSRTVDAVYGTNFATVENGKVKVLDSITGDQAMQYLAKSGVYGNVAQ